MAGRRALVACHTQHAGEFTERFRPDLKSIFLNAEMRSQALSETT